jgi:hypothetical protein
MMKGLRKRFGRTPVPFHWPPHLARYADCGPHLAVALRQVDKLNFRAPERLPYALPVDIWEKAQMQLSPQVRYMDVALENAGINNFLLRATPIVMAD